MKNVKKIALALLLVAVLVAGVVVAVFANTYKGNIEKYTSLVEKAVKASEISTKGAALEAVDQYLLEKPVDPASEGYDKVTADFMAAKLAMVELCITAEAADNAAAIANADLACKWFNSAWRGVDTSADDRYAPLAEKLNTFDVGIADILFGAVDQDVLTKENADGASAAEDAEYKLFKSFLDRHFFIKDSAEYTELAEKADALVLAYNTAKAARYEAIVSQARLTDYLKSKTPVTNYTFQTVGSLPSVSNASGYNKNGLALSNTSGREVMMNEDGTENGYFSLHINGAMNASATS